MTTVHSQQPPLPYLATKASPDRMRKAISKLFLRQRDAGSIIPMMIGALLLLASSIAIAVDSLESFPEQKGQFMASSSLAGPSSGHYPLMARKSLSKVREASGVVVAAEPAMAGKSSSLSKGETKMGQLVLDSLQLHEEGDNGNHAIGRRMLVQEGKLVAKVPILAFDSATAKIVSFVEDADRFGAGGYVASRQSSENEYFYTTPLHKSKKKVQRTIQLNLRIPSLHFDSFVKSLQTFIEQLSVDEADDNDQNPRHKKGKIISMSTQARDVTDEYVDATARADTLDSSRNALRTLLSDADSVEDVIKVHAELNSLTQQSESLRRRALDLKRRADLSDLNLRLEEWKYGEDDDEDDQDEDGFGNLTRRWTPLRAVLLAWRHIGWAMTFAFDTLAYGIMWTFPLFVVYSLFNLAFSKSGRR